MTPGPTGGGSAGGAAGAGAPGETGAAGADGTYEVLAVRYGTRETDRAETYLGFSVYGEPNAPMTMDYYFWVLRNRRRTLLVDCGFSPAVGARRGRTTLCPPVEALGRLGLSPDRLDAMVVTHAHYDHIGNLDRFPEVQLVASRREVEFWSGPLGSRRQFTAATETEELARLREAAGTDRLTVFEERHTVAPGVELVEVGGHTPGQAVVLVGTAAGQVVLSSDALHFYEELERDWPFSVVADLEAMYRGFDLLRELASGPGRTLVAGHDPEVMKRFPTAGPGLEDLAVRVG